MLERLRIYILGDRICHRPRDVVEEELDPTLPDVGRGPARGELMNCVAYLLDCVDKMTGESKESSVPAVLSRRSTSYDCQVFAKTSRLGFFCYS